MLSGRSQKVEARTISYASAREPFRPSCGEVPDVPARLQASDDLEDPVAAERVGHERRPEFEITIDRSASGKKNTLGISYDDSDQKTLVIYGLKDGLFYEWNRKSSSEFWVLIGDSIIECNGVHGDSEAITQECLKKQVLHMKIRRAPPERIAPVCTADDNEVTVHVYDLFGHRTRLTRFWNSLTTRFGAFHTGIEVYGVEFWFGAHPEGGFDGVYVMSEPRRHECHSYRTSIRMGPTSLSRSQLESILPLLRVSWPGWSYDPFRRNCHSFTDAFCKVLGFRAGPKFGLFGVGSSIASLRNEEQCVEQLNDGRINL